MYKVSHFLAVMFIVLMLAATKVQLASRFPAVAARSSLV